ncbi:MAG: TIGR01212 family radical SAM protein [Candidatus Eremiobacterota bacterium]
MKGEEKIVKNPKRYVSLNNYLKEKFGSRVHKVPLDAGFTCPNRDGSRGMGGCIYCNSLGSGTGASREGKSIEKQMEEGINYLSKRFKTNKFIAYFQSYSSSYGPVEKLKKLYDSSLIDDRVVGLSIGTRPDCLNKEILDLLEDYQKKNYMVWLELGLQSVHNKTLELINRHHTFEDFLSALDMAKGNGLLVCTHIIFGLPGEDYRDMIETAKKLSKLPVDGVKFHSLYVIKGTPMEKLLNEGIYKPITEEEYVNIVCEAIALLPKHVVIQRLTGDPKKGELVEPLWTMNKQKTLSLIEKNLIEKDLWQGKFLTES